MPTCRCTTVTLVLSPKSPEVRLAVDPRFLYVGLVLPVHHVVLGKLVGLVHLIDGLVEFLRLWPFDVELVQEFFIEFLQLDEVCCDVVVLVPRDEGVPKLDCLLAAG